MTKKKVIVFLAAMALLLFIIDCNENKVDKKALPEAYESVITNDARRLGVKKTLRWICDSGDMMNSANIVKRFNELLVDKYGCDFVVEFYGYRTVHNGSGEYTTYDEILSEIKEAGLQADILYAGNEFTYSDMVNGGYYAPITDQLMNIEEGRMFYEAFPETMWEQVTLNNEIYGYSTYHLPARFPVLCNKEKAEKLKLEIGEEFDFYDIGEMLEKADVDFDAKEMERVVPIVASIDALVRNAGYYDTERGIYLRKNAAGGWEAFNYAEDEEFIRLMKCIREYKEKGWYACRDYMAPSARTMVDQGGYVFGVKLLVEIRLAENRVLPNEYDGKIHDVIIGKMNYGYLGKREHGIYGIASWSEYQDEAFKLLSLVNSEPELANLIRYGIAKEDYLYNGDKVVDLKPYASGARDLVNPYITYSVGVEPDNKLEYIKSIEEGYEYGPMYLYDLDWSGTDDEMAKLRIVYNRYKKGLFCGEYEDVEATLEQMSAELKEAGIDKVMGILNEQMK